MLSLTAAGASPATQKLELDRSQALLQQWLSEPSVDDGVVVERDEQRLRLRVPAAQLFAPDSTALKPEALRAAPLTAAVRLLKAQRQLHARVVVFTDSIGGAGDNRKFSEQRAAALYTALTSAGISAKRLHAEGAGEGTPLAGNDTPEGRLQNRRLEIVFQRGAS